MTDLELYERQKELGIKLPESVVIIGCGGLGFWTASSLVACGVQEITLVDGDSIELSNLNRTLYPLSSVGINKAEALKAILSSTRPNTRTTSIPIMCSISELELLVKPDCVIVDCTDDYEFQRSCYTWCIKNSFRYVRVGCRTNHITVTSVVPDWSIGSKERVRCGEHIAAWIVPCMKAAQYAVDKIVRRPDLEVSEEV